MVRAPRSHRGGRRFKSSIAHHVEWDDHEPGLGPRSPGRGGGTADALRSGRSIRMDVWVQIPPSAPTSFPAGCRPTCACSSVDRALPCGGRGREFESRQAHHYLASLNPLASHSHLAFAVSRSPSPFRWRQTVKHSASTLTLPLTERDFAPEICQHPDSSSFKRVCRS